MKVGQVLLVAAVAASSAVLVAQGPRRDGNWEVTMEMQGANLPPGMPPIKTTQCITKEQAADPQKFLPAQPQRGGTQNDCKVSDYKTEGNKVSWSVSCTTPQQMNATGEMVYSGDTYVGTLAMNMSRGGQPMSMTTKMSGKRLGDCVK